MGLLDALTSIAGGASPEHHGVADARDGIEPPNKGFADLSLTVWVPRHSEKQIRPASEIYL